MRRLLLLLALAAPAHAAPERLILGLDGAAYDAVRAAQRGEGGRRCLAGFPPAARLVSTYPSLSDVAWADILGLGRSESYQPLHYDYARGELRGARGLESMGDTTESSLVMDWKLEGAWTNLMGYLFPRRVFRAELARAREAFQRSEERDFYAHIQTFDYAVHMGRDPREYLCEVDAWLADLRRGAPELEVVILSDHGSDGLVPRRAPIRRHLKRAGFRPVKRLERPGDVVLPTDGMLNVVQACPLPADVAGVAQALSEMPEVDLVTYAAGSEVRVLKGAEEAVVLRRGTRYAYRPLVGDPLDYARVVARLKRRGLAGRDGFAPAEAWLAATLGHRYPAALERVTRAHHGLVRKPAPVIASLRPGRVAVNAPTWYGSRLVRLGGTHGALDADSSSGVALWSKRRLPDTTTDRLRRHLGGLAQN